MKILTWSDSLCPELDLLMSSAKRLSTNIEIIALGYKVDRRANFKIDALQEAVLDLPSEEIVLCTDGYDVLHLADTDEIEEKFKAYNVPLIFNAERSYSHQLKAYKEYFERDTDLAPYQYLNSGCLIGYAQQIREMLSVVKSYDDSEPMVVGTGIVVDQTLIGKYYVENPGKVTLDHKCHIFWNMALEWNEVLEGALIRKGRIMNLTTRTLPAIVHVPFRRKYAWLVESLHEKLCLSPYEELSEHDFENVSVQASTIGLGSESRKSAKEMVWITPEIG